VGVLDLLFQTVATLWNAMDVSRPNNWPRVEELCRRNGWALETLGSGMRDDAQTRDALQRLHQLDYLCEPHGAIAWDLLGEQLAEDEVGVFLCTAHPAKFKESVDEILNLDVPLPGPLAKHAELPLLSVNLPAEFARLRAFLVG
jgi:threonine synthase